MIVSRSKWTTSGTGTSTWAMVLARQAASIETRFGLISVDSEGLGVVVGGVHVALAVELGQSEQRLALTRGVSRDRPAQAGHGIVELSRGRAMRCLRTSHPPIELPVRPCRPSWPPCGLVTRSCRSRGSWVPSATVRRMSRRSHAARNASGGPPARARRPAPTRILMPRPASCFGSRSTASTSRSGMPRADLSERYFRERAHASAREPRSSAVCSRRNRSSCHRVQNQRLIRHVNGVEVDIRHLTRDQGASEPPMRPTVAPRVSPLNRTLHHQAIHRPSPAGFRLRGRTGGCTVSGSARSTNRSGELASAGVGDAERLCVTGASG